MGVLRRVAVAMAAVVGMSVVTVPMASAGGSVVPPSKPLAASFSAISCVDPSMTCGRIMAQWTSPFDNGGAPVTRYEVAITRKSDGSSVGGCTYDVPDPANPPGVMTCEVTDLATGVEYNGSITPYNSAGAGSVATNNTKLRPIGPPDHPTKMTVTPGPSSFTLTWDAPLNDGGDAVTGYTVNIYDPTDLINHTPRKFCEIKTLPATLKCTISDPSLSGTDWLIGYTAENTQGLGIEGFAAPDPASVSASVDPSGTSAVVSWTRNPDVIDGSDLTWGYVIVYGPDGLPVYDGSGNLLTCSSQASSCTVLGLDPTVTYTFKVIDGVYPLLTGTPGSQPTKPVGTSDKDKKVPVNWTYPGTGTDGQSPVFFVQAYDKNGNKVGTGDVNNPGAGSCVATFATTNCTVPGLTNGQPYTFIVTPYDSTKTKKGIASLLSDPAIPAGPPSIPLNVQAPAKNGTIDISWDPSADDGGAAIDRYEVTVTDPNGVVVGTCTVLPTDPLSCSVGNGQLSTTAKYTVSVRAHNRINYGPPATVSNVIPVLALTNTAGFKKMRVAVGDVGVVYRSKDKGSTWARDDTGTTANLHSVVCPLKLLCLTVGDGGTIRYWKGPSAGATPTWAPATDPNTTENLWSVSCDRGSTVCVAAGDHGTVMVSDPTDNVWTQIPGVPVVDYKGVACPSKQDCLVIGAGGTLLKLTAPFTTFQAITTSPATTQDLNAIRCPSPTYCLAVGDEGKVIAAKAPWTNANVASTWKQITVTTGQDLRGIACPALSNICVVVGTGGMFISTQKSNVRKPQAWVMAKTNFSFDLDKVRCSTKVDCVAVAPDHLTTATWNSVVSKWKVKIVQ